jgi:hypothetical protein
MEIHPGRADMNKVLAKLAIPLAAAAKVAAA